MSNVALALALPLLTLAIGCGRTWESPWPIEGGPAGGSGGQAGDGGESSSGEPMTDGSSSESSSGSSGGGSSGGSDGSPTGCTGSSTGGLACMLPDFDPWCLAQLGVAQSVGCSGGDEPSACYATISAQYEGADPSLVEAADCDAAEPGCTEALLECFEAAGDPMCLLLEGDGLDACEGNATDAGVDATAATAACEVMLSIYG